MALTEKDFIQARAAMCKKSLYYFAQEFIPEIETKDIIWNWHIEYLCNEVEDLILRYVHGEPTEHLNINICPSTTKSTIFSRILTPWIWTFAPHTTTINVTRASDNVKNFSIAAKQIIDSNKYQTYFGLKIKQSPDTISYFQNEKGGIRYAFTTNSKESTGKHADLIIFDDVQSWTDIYSEKEIDQTNRGIDGFLSRYKDRDRGILINVMQRLGANDATSYLFKGEESKLVTYKHICLPSEVSELVHPEELKDRYIDGLLDPIRLSSETLSKEKRKFGISYAPQYQQDVKATVDDLQYPAMNEYDYVIDMKRAIVLAASDPSGSGEDYFATLYVAVFEDKIHAFDAIYTKDGLGEGRASLISKTDMYMPIVNEIETNQDGGLLVSLLSDKGLPVHPARESQNKLMRIDAFSPYHRSIYWAKNGSPHYQKFKESIKHFKKGQSKNDDAADAYTKILRILHYNYKYLLHL